MNSARDAVLELQVHLGDGVLGEDGGVGDITCSRNLISCPLLHDRCDFRERFPYSDAVTSLTFRAPRLSTKSSSSFGVGCEQVQGSHTDGSRLNHVADGEPLDGLVLGDAAGAVGAAHRLDVAAAVLVAAARNQSAPSPGINSCATQSPFSLYRNARRLLLSIPPGLVCVNRVRGRHCGDHVERETASQILGRNRPYLFALFLTILTDCSVEGQRFELECVERKRMGEGAYGWVVGVGCRSSLTQRLFGNGWGWLCCGKP